MSEMLNFDPYFNQVLKYVTSDGTIDSDDKQLLIKTLEDKAARENRTSLNQAELAFINGMKSGLTLEIKTNTGQSILTSINLELDDSTSVGSLKALLKNGVKSQEEFNLLTETLSNPTLAKSLVEEYGKDTKLLVMDYAKTLRKFQADINGKINKSTDFNNLQPQNFISKSSVHAINNLAKVAKISDKGLRDTFFKAIAYELTMEVYYKKGGEKSLGVILKGNGAETFLDDYDMIKIANAWGKGKQRTVIHNLEDSLTLALIMNDERVDSLATFGHGNPDGMLLKNGMVETDFTQVPASKTIKNIIMLNCHSAFIPGLEKAFPNAKSWKLNKTAYYSGFDSPDAKESLREKYRKQMDDIGMTVFRLDVAKRDKKELKSKDSTTDVQIKELDAKIKDLKAKLEKFKKDYPDLEDYIKNELNKY